MMKVVTLKMLCTICLMVTKNRVSELNVQLMCYRTTDIS